jgi:phenylpyruvate tautomerase PptA (4-oxalocrotonate tautomerase family)
MVPSLVEGQTGSFESSEPAMPNIVITIPKLVLDVNSKKTLVEGINSVAVEAEQIADNSNSRFLCWVVIDETAPANWTCGGSDVGAAFIPVLVVVHVPAGVLEKTTREQYADGVHRAVLAALPDEKRQILTSCIFNEVENGLWGVNGHIWDLKDFARHAGFRHLQHLVEVKAR